MNDALKEQVLSALEKIKTEADTLIAERDALKQALRKAQDACQRLREERDAAKREAGWSKLKSQKVDTYAGHTHFDPATFTPALGASPKTREDFAACPVGTIVRFNVETIHWEKKDTSHGAVWVSSGIGISEDDKFMAEVALGKPRITLLPLARKAEAGGYQDIGTLGDILKAHAERRATSPVPEWKDHVRIPPAPPAVIRKGEKIDTPAQYDALPPGSRVRKAAGDWWTKMPNGDWWCAGEKMRDLAFPRTVLRIGYDDTAVSFDVVGVALKQDKPALRVGDMCSGKGYASLPVGSLVAYSGDGETQPQESWHKVGVDSWRDVSGKLSVDLCSDARMAMERTPRKIKRIGPEPARFHVGQVISTREEYEALPVGASVWFNKDTRFPGDKVFAFWTKEHKDKWRSGSGSGADNRNLADIGREIRSLP